MSTKLKPRIIMPREPEPRGMPLWCIALIVVLLLIVAYIAYSRGYYTGRAIALQEAADKVDTSMALPEKDDAEPQKLDDASPELHGAPVPLIAGVSEPLPESDAPRPAKPSRAAKDEPSADELNARWLVRYPHGAPRLVPVL